MRVSAVYQKYYIIYCKAVFEDHFNIILNVPLGTYVFILF